MSQSTTPFVHYHDDAKDLTMQPGEKVALIGSSGSGKSTLLRGILGLSNQGETTLPASGIGVAFQQAGIFDGCSIAENLGAQDAASLDDQARATLAGLRIGELSPDQSASQLSGGQQKRLAIARALLLGSQLVILDEPTSGLDFDSSIYAARVIRRHCEATGAALLFVTHDNEFAAALADRILRVHRDGMLEDATAKIKEAASPHIQEAMRLPLEQEIPYCDIDSRQESLRESVMDTTRWRATHILADNIIQCALLAWIPMCLLGVLTTIQTAQTVPFDYRTAIPGLLVSVMYREFAPLVVGLLTAARMGTRLTSELAGMSYTSQLDTMRVMGMNLVSLIARPAIIALAILLPTLIILGAFLGVYQGYLLADKNWYGLDISGLRFEGLAHPHHSPLLVFGAFAKGIIMGAGIAVITFIYGCKAVGSATALGQTVTRSTMACAAFVVITDLVVSLLLYV
jgi:ABC-type lipoprotein export system ATPase subunit/ABC-type transporter Mla maintaining outer membrane lipid asymmetry permease subunit MlaE